MEIRPMGAEFLLADGPTDGHRKHKTKLTVACCTFANAPKNQSVNAV